VFKSSRLTTLVALVAGAVSAQTISPYLVGNNAWMPPWRYGNIDALWGKMETAKFQTIRVGGNEAMTDNKAIGAGAQSTGYYRVLYLIDSVRGAGAEPIVQVPHEYSTAEAKQYIAYINGTAKRGIKLWSIGNEPDNNGVGDGYFVGAYTQRISSGLKSYDPNAIVIAGDHAWYNTQHLDILLGTGASSIAGKDAAGNYYVDVISWHRYGLNDISSIEANVDDFRARVAKINATRPANRQMTWALGEMNMHYRNDYITNADQYPWTFHAGQVFAEAYDLGMRKGGFTICPWAMHEHGGDRATTLVGTNVPTDLSLFDSPSSGYAARSTYWHSLMLGQNMKTNYLAHTANTANLTIISMGDATGVAVMLLNKSKTTAIPFDLRLDNGTFTGKSATQIRVQANLGQEVSGTLAAYSTQMLVFDAAGKLVKRYIYSSTNADGKSGPAIDYPNVVAPACNASAVSAVLQAETYCRESGTQSQTTTDVGGGMNVGYTDAGDLLAYSLKVPAAGAYKFQFRVASANAGSSFSVSLGGKLLGNVAVGNTGGWQVWTTRTMDATLAAGTQELLLQITGSGVNLNWLQFDPVVVVNKVPVVGLSASAASAVAPANLTLTATPTDSDGTIEKVEFLQNGVVVQTLTSAPWTWSAANLAMGAYAFTAKATDNAGASTTSATASVVITAPANKVPAVSIAASATTGIAPAAFTLTATATDTDGTIAKVELLQNGVVVETQTLLPWDFYPKNLAAGTYSFAFRATDNSGATSTSAAIAVTVTGVVVNKAPAVSLASSAATATAPASLALTATANDTDGTISKVELLQNGVVVQTKTASPWQFSVAGLAAGSYAFTAKATDNSGASATSSASTVVVSAAPAINKVPVVGLSSSAATAVAPASLILTATATDSDGTISKVELLQNGVVVQTKTASPWQFSVAGLAAGSYAFTAKATDNAGSTSISSAASVLVSAATNGVGLAATPNPMTSTGSMTYTLASQPTSNPVFVVYDASGIPVRTFVEQNPRVGANSTYIENSNQLSAGSYTVKMTIGNVLVGSCTFRHF